MLMMFCYIRPFHPLLTMKIYREALTVSTCNLNQAKCKFMLISRKRNPVLCLKPLQLNGVVLDSVQSFKYLGVMLTSDMSWSTHVSMVCSRARKILGVIYRQFYANATSAVLLQLSMVRPHVEYAAAVWSPHLKKDIALIEGVQKFALSGVWCMGSKLSSSSLPLQPTYT